MKISFSLDDKNSDRRGEMMAADVELYRLRQAQTAGISSLWCWRGPPKKSPSTAAGRLVPEDFYRRNLHDLFDHP
jgi:hypothetical protein